MTVTMHVATPDDGSLLIEWIGKGWRLGLSLERDAKESSWYLVSNTTQQGEQISRNITAGDRKRIADFVRGWGSDDRQT